VLAGAIAGASTQYLKRLYDAGLRGHDGISVHPYAFILDGPNPGFGDPALLSGPFGPAGAKFTRGVPHMRRTMIAEGDRAKIWLTEFGFAACPAEPHCVSESEQARRLAASFRIASRWRYVRGLTTFSLRDGGTSDNWNFRFGLLRRDFSRRPSYDSVRRALAELREEWNFTAKRRQPLARALRRGIRFGCGSNEAGRCTVRATLNGRRVGRRDAYLAGAGRRALRLKLNRRGRRLLAGRERRARIRLKGAVTDLAGNRDEVGRTIVLVP